MAIPILMYHQVGVPAPRGTRFRSLTVHPDRFCSQMRWMARLGYQGLSMRDLIPYVQGKKSGKVFGVTFDDGFRNVFEHALPVLNELNFTATNYFLPRQLGTSNVWDVNQGVPKSDLMSVAEMRQWSAAGQEVGSHALEHVHLPQLSDDQAMHQIRDSRLALEDLIGQPVSAFCYPYGDHQPKHRLMVQEAGYSNATTTQRGLALSSDDIFGLPRVGIWRSTHLLKFFQKVLTGYEQRRRR